MALNNAQAEAWISRLKQHLPDLLSHPNPKQFLGEQYALLFLLVRALDGEVTFVGAPEVETHE